ncbi:MAG: hypothetical protein PHV55_04405 [Candidatus Omnitrophica bacterium]|nr:hypothetical protein [Candidatus Omnitrophota bacterium]
MHKITAVLHKNSALLFYFFKFSVSDVSLAPRLYGTNGAAVCLFDFSADAKPQKQKHYKRGYIKDEVEKKAKQHQL